MEPSPVTDERREGDTRPLEHDARVSLTLTPAEDRPFRWLPRHGQPYCIGEWATQHVIRLLAWAPLYVALIVTLILVVQLGHPFGLGR
jgi:hypothetical protein